MAVTKVAPERPRPEAATEPNSTRSVVVSVIATPVDLAICCESVAPVLGRVGDKWSMLIVMLLTGGPVRFNELKRRIGGISQRMLSLTLRNLERDGLVSRTVTPSVPPRVDYALTVLGQSLAKPVRALGDWAHANHHELAAAQRRYDGRAA